MAENVFEEIIDVNKDIDLSLFAHIHSDAFLKGSYELEGNEFRHTINYLKRYFDELKKQSALPPGADTLVKRMRGLVDIETKITSLREEDPKTAKPSLDQYTDELATRLLTKLNIGEYISIPGGWVDRQGGHAMVYQFRRTADGFDFYVFNSGSGLQYHEKQSAADRELFYPVQAYKIPQLPSKTKLAHFLRDLMLPQIPTLRPAAEQSFNETKLYEKVLPRISYIGGELTPIGEHQQQLFTAGQISGTCTQRSLHQMLKENFADASEYQRFIYGFKRYALRDYLHKLQTNIEPYDERSKVLIDKAIQTLAKTLKTPNLFTQEQTNTELQFLQTCRENLAKLPIIQGPKPSIKATNFVHKIQFNVHEPGIPKTSRVNIAQPSLAPAEQTQGPTKIQGGADLIKQLEKLFQDCERLAQKGEDLSIIEQLELVFTNFPLPPEHEWKNPIHPFYANLSPSNQGGFYKLIGNLQNQYVEACRRQCGNAVLPRMWIVGISTLSVIDYVTAVYPLSAVKGLASVTEDGYHQFTKYRLGRHFNINEWNPYYASNQPKLDERLQSIKSVYAEGPCFAVDLINYYNGIITKDSSLQTKLSQRRVKDAAFNSLLGKLNPKFRAALQSGNGKLLDLYYLTTNFEALEEISEFKILIYKFKSQMLLERAKSLALSPFLEKTDLNQKIELTYNTITDKIEVQSVEKSLGNNIDERRVLVNYKYQLPTNLPCQQALAQDYNQFYVSKGTLNPKERNDNAIQLSLSDKKVAKNALAARQIDSREIAEREFYHLRASPQNQIKLTIDYFQQHLDKLSDSACQIYMQANLFEPRLLMDELDTNPEILNSIECFIESGLKHYSERGFTTQNALFFIQLAYLMMSYAEQYKPQLATGKLAALQERISSILEQNEENDCEIKQGLHYYQFLTVMARLKLNRPPLSPEEQQSLLELALPSYFFMNAKNPASSAIDAATKFELDQVGHDFKCLVFGKTPKQLTPSIACMIEKLGLGHCERVIEAKGFFYTIEVKQGNRSRVFKLDVASGLVFNEKGMAYKPLPLNLRYHPVMPSLKFDKFDPCFVSADGSVFELGDEEIRFIQCKTDTGIKYKVQKKWMIEGKTQWYELHSLNSEQKISNGLLNEVAFLPLSLIFKQRDSQIWCNCEENGNFLITVDGCPAYRRRAQEMALKQLNEKGEENGFQYFSQTTETIIHDDIATVAEKNSFLEYFSNFEHCEFITTCENQGTIQIKFPRYGLTLLARQDAGEWVFRLENDPSYTLDKDAILPIPGAAGLIFKNTETGQRTCYFPLQQFIRAEGVSPHSEFHRFEQDIALKIPQEQIKDAVEKNKHALQPWQYTGQERLVAYQLNQNGEPIPESTTEALYLCYMYLGCHQPEKAWAVLEDCAKRFGGLQGSYEELSLLNWIVNSLPCIIAKKDSKATVKTPAVVACQLRALALLTSTFTPDKVISFPDKNFDLKTPDGLYQDLCHKTVSSFTTNLNSTLYQLYSTYQKMQRHAEYGFQLRDDERKNLLDYYHFNLSGNEPKVLGALGYEWQKLQLKALRLELETLQAEVAKKGPLPKGYQKRIKEIKDIIAEDQAVHAHHTDLEKRAIDLQIPANMPAFDFSGLDNEDGATNEIQSWWGEFSLADTSAHKAVEAVRALDPDISYSQFFRHFPSYYKLVTRKPLEGLGTEVMDFCRQYLIASRHTSLEKQETRTAYLCNILYRIGRNQAEFVEAAKTAIQPKSGCQVILKLAEQMPAPKDIEIYQAIDRTSTVLARTSDIWRELDKETFVRSEPMEAAECTLLDNFGIEKLINNCQFVSEKERLVLSQAKEYKKMAKIFGAAPEKRARPQSLANADQPKKLVLTDEDIRAGREQSAALQDMKQIAKAMLVPSNRNVLKNKATDFINILDAKRQTQLDGILTLANSGPRDAAEKLRRELELEGRVRAPLDEQRLLALYFKADEASYKSETGLSDDQIKDLHNQLSHFLACSVRQQALQRFCKEIDDAGPNPDESALQKIANELLVDDCVDYKTQPVLALLQYYENILLRPQQIKAIERLIASPDKDKYTYDETIEKIIMGGGKSKVILPVIAQAKATGSNLVVIEAPRALLNTYYTDLSNTSRRLFNQKVHRFDFNRDSDCSPKCLEFHYAHLNEVIVNRDYLVTTGDAVESLELKYYELLFQEPEKEEDKPQWNLQIKWLDKILTLFRTRADVVMDEVHQALQLNKKLNYTLGNKRGVPPAIIEETLALYRFLGELPLSKALNNAEIPGTLESLLVDNELLKQGENSKAIFTYLLNNLLEHHSSPLKRTIQKMHPPLSAAEKEELLLYLQDKGAGIPNCVHRCNEKIKANFALYKEQVSQLLQKTLKRKLNVNYGASKRRAEEGIAIPYVANNVPSERSRFGNFLVAINLSIQMLMIEGFRPYQLKHYLSSLQEQARQELFKNKQLKSIDGTAIAQGFAQWTGDLGLSLSQIHLDDDQQFDTVYRHLHKNKNLIFEVLKTDILTKINIDSEILHSDAFNHVDIYRSCQGLTGTPSNSSTYHQRLSYKKETAAATDGFIIDLLRQKKTTIRKIVGHSPAELLKGLLESKEPGDSVRAIIDICAMFKGVSNLEVSQGLAKYVKDNPAKFALPEPVKYIMYFNEEDVLCALDINKGTSILVESSDPDVIKAKLKCGPAGRLSYYDQSHTIGTDLKQDVNAEGLDLVDQETQLQAFLQGSMRMRGLQDEQNIDIIVPATMDVNNLDELIILMAANEERQLQQDNFAAAQAKMENCIRADCMRRILAVDNGDVARKHQLAQAFKHYFVEQSSLDFFELYGGISRFLSAKDILDAQKKRLFEGWEAILKDQKIMVPATEATKMNENLQEIISGALPLCNKDYLSPTRQEQGMEVEIQKETQVELQGEAQLERELFDPSLVACGYEPWSSGYINFLQVHHKFGECKRLQERCEQSRPPAPDFGDIYVSPNYAKTYTTQTDAQFIGPYLKPVHCILFRNTALPGQALKLNCVLLSQQEAEELTTYFKNHTAVESANCWLCTTQHTVLAGQAPQEVRKNEDYQALIEQARFFNGELKSLLSGDLPLNWLSKGTVEKLNFFEQHLLPNREASHQDLTLLKQALSKREDAFRYIVEHPMLDPHGFDWLGNVSEELSANDIVECEHLVEAIANVNSTWKGPNFNLEQHGKDEHLSMQAAAYLGRYKTEKLDSLEVLLYLLAREPSIQANIAEIGNRINELPLSFIQNYLPGAPYKKGSLLAQLLIKASKEQNPKELLLVAESLLQKKADVNAVDTEGFTVIAQVIRGGGEHAVEMVQWLQSKGANFVVKDEAWVGLHPLAMEKFRSWPSLQRNETFFLAGLVVYRDSQEKLRDIVKSAPNQADLFKAFLKAIETSPSKELIAVLFEHPLFHGEVEIRAYKSLLKSRKAPLQSEQLLQILTKLDFNTKEGQGLLVDIAGQVPVNDAVMRAIAANMKEPSVAILDELLANTQIKKIEDTLVGKFFATKQSELVKRLLQTNKVTLTAGNIELLLNTKLSEDLISALLANDQFMERADWIGLLLNKLEKEAHPKLIQQFFESETFKSKSIDIITKLVEIPDPTIMSLLATKLNETDIRALLFKPFTPALITLIISCKNISANFLNMVIGDMVFYALDSDPTILADFWRKLFTKSWNKLNDNILINMILKLSESEELITELLKSSVFQDNRQQIVQLITKNSSEPLLKLLKAKLSKADLMALLYQPDPNQEVLRLIATAKAADYQVLSTLITVLDQPKIELINDLIASDIVLEIIYQLSAKVIGQDCEAIVKNGLNSKSDEAITNLINKYKTNPKHLNTIFTYREKINIDQLKAMLPLPEEVKSWKQLDEWELSLLFNQILAHNRRLKGALYNEVINTAKMLISPTASFWRNVKLPMPPISPARDDNKPGADIVQLPIELPVSTPITDNSHPIHKDELANDIQEDNQSPVVLPVPVNIDKPSPYNPNLFKPEVSETIPPQNKPDEKSWHSDLEKIYEMLKTHRYVLRGGGTEIAGFPKKFSKSAGHLIPQIDAVLKNKNARSEDYNKIFSTIQKELEKKAKVTWSIFWFGTRHESTAKLYRAVLDIANKALGVSTSQDLKK